MPFKDKEHSETHNQKYQLRRHSSIGNYNDGLPAQGPKFRFPFRYNLKDESSSEIPRSLRGQNINSDNAGIHHAVYGPLSVEMDNPDPHPLSDSSWSFSTSQQTSPKPSNNTGDNEDIDPNFEPYVPSPLSLGSPALPATIAFPHSHLDKAKSKLGLFKRHKYKSIASPDEKSEYNPSGFASRYSLSGSREDINNDSRFASILSLSTPPPIDTCSICASEHDRKSVKEGDGERLSNKGKIKLIDRIIHHRSASSDLNHLKGPPSSSSLFKRIPSASPAVHPQPLSSSSKLNPMLPESRMLSSPSWSSRESSNFALSEDKCRIDDRSRELSSPNNARIQTPTRERSSSTPIIMTTPPFDPSASSSGNGMRGQQQQYATGDENRKVTWPPLENHRPSVDSKIDFQKLYVPNGQDDQKINASNDQIDAKENEHLIDDSHKWCPIHGGYVYPPVEDIIDRRATPPLISKSRGFSNDIHFEVFGPSRSIPSEQRKKISYLRVYRHDGSFGTIACTLETTVSDLIQTLGKKFFIHSVEGAQLILKTSGINQVLGPNEHPLAYQLVYLELMGYTSRDNLDNIGRDDISYLCQFSFVESGKKNWPSEKSEDQQRYLNPGNSLSEVKLNKRNLQTVPLILYWNASLIEYLDLSQNPIIVVPLSFAKACTNLKYLDFSQNRLRNFPDNLIAMENLKTLDLSANYLRELPEELFLKMVNLETLKLKGNKLANLPSSFISLADTLTYLDLSSNYFDHFPRSLCDATSLEYLDISFNRILVVPTEISNFVKLKTFYINNNSLINRLPDELGSLKSLTDLDLKYNYLQNIDILSELSSLETLICSKNKISRFSNILLNQLKKLYLDKNPISEINLNAPAPSLIYLNVSGARLGSLNSNLMTMIPNLEKLILDDNHLNLTPTDLWHLKKLKFLSCANNNLEYLPNDIGNLISLEHLDLHSNNICELPVEITDLHNLKYLNLSSNLLESFPKCCRRTLSSEDSDVSPPTRPTRNPPESTRLQVVHDNSNNTINSDNNHFDVPRRASIVSSDNSSSEPLSRRLSVVSQYSTLSPLSSVATGSDSLPESREEDLESKTALNPIPKLADSLQVLILCDNRLNDDCFEDLTLLTELRILNISYNYLAEIPISCLGRFTKLTELYISGNNLSSLPADDLESLSQLQTLFANSNKLHSLPAELGKNFKLRAFDAGTNFLKYNISNWPYDWNWHFNLGLKYLNFSGNRRLEIKSAIYPGQLMSTSYDRNDLSDFTVLHQIRILGLMDVTLTTSSVPDQSENCRVRTYGSEIKDLSIGMADTLGIDENLSINDMVIEQFRGNESDHIFGIFDGQNQSLVGGNKISKFIQEIFGREFCRELKKMSGDDTIVDALRRAFLCTNRNIGLAINTPSEEKNLNMAAHRSSTAAHVSYDDGLSGSCGTVCYVNGRKVYVANVGDTMAIMATTGGEYHVLTRRHDTLGNSEFSRIRAAGGVIDRDGKLAGVTTVSRAFGFYNLVPCFRVGPSITEYDLTDLDELIIMASSEFWNYVSYEAAVDIALSEAEDPMRAANKLRDFAISYGATNKMMVMCISVDGAGRRKKHKMMIKATSGSAGTPVGSLTPTTFDNDTMYPLLRRRPRDRSLMPEDSMLARLGGEVNAPIGELALVFTDIQKSTQLWETYPIAMRSAIKIHNGIMRRQLRIVGGYEVKTEGDAFMVSFSTAPLALLWCLNVQAQLLLADWPMEILECPEAGELMANGVVIYKGLLVRMGIHWGSPVCERDPVTKRMDYYGPVVNRAARIGAKADGGQIMVSADFLSVIGRLEAIYKRPEGSDGYLSTRDEEAMKQLKSTSKYVVNEVGETKLKGLENAEFLSLIFSEHLIKRSDYPPCSRNIAFSRRDDKKLLSNRYLNQVRQATQPSPLTTAMVSTRAEDLTMQGVVFDTLGIQSLLRIRNVSLRLEQICSRLNRENYYDGPILCGDFDSNFDPLSGCGSQWLGTGLSPTQQNLILMLDRVVTRIENSLLVLYLRISLARTGAKSRSSSSVLSNEDEGQMVKSSRSGSNGVSDRKCTYSVNYLIHKIKGLVSELNNNKKSSK